MTAKKTETVEVKGTPVGDDKLSPDEQARVDAVEAEDKKQQLINDTAADAGRAEAEKAAKAAGPVDKVEVDALQNGADKPKPRKPVLDKAEAAAAKKGVHIVAPGEDLNDIATKYGVGTASLAELNRLQTGYRGLEVGQEIKLYPDHVDGTQV